ncbi:MAG: DnaA regulatory inactivator Hda [Gammaproteobacteria bacterium]|nr:DnaA regulatory inactivator Hda [Gammaproteobacteria bacterium]
MPPGPEDQLPLAVGLADEANFDNFVVSRENLQIVTWLREPERLDSPVLIWGPPASGRTHLLQACCHLAGNRRAFFLPLRHRLIMRPEILDDLAEIAMICIDDVQLAAGDADWERALVRLLNSVNPAASRLVLAASAPAAKIGWALADLRSRLQQALSFRLHPLNETGIRQAFTLRARNRGLRLDDGVVDYIFLRAERRLDALMAILDRLDESSIRRQRHITIPQVKRILGW